MSQNAQRNVNAQAVWPVSDLPYLLARRIAAVAGVFSLIVCALLWYDYSRRRVEDHFSLPAMIAAYARLYRDLSRAREANGT